MTADDIIAAINAAKQGSAVETAERLLGEYTGDDKALIEPDLIEMAVTADWADAEIVI